MAKSFSPEVEAAINQAAAQHGVSPQRLRTFITIESGGNPTVRTGSYVGLGQLSPAEFAKHGGGDILNPADNASALASKLKAEGADLGRKLGREPTDAEIYMVHQQGVGGAAAHAGNPDAPAWQNMAGTGEGRAKGEAWAKQAIWGNVPDDVKRQYGSVENMTSRQFTDLWGAKVAGFGGAPAQPAQSDAPAVGMLGPPPTQQAASGAPSALTVESPATVQLPSVASVLGIDGALDGVSSGLKSAGIGSLDKLPGGFGGFGGDVAAAEPEASPFAATRAPRKIDPSRLRAAIAARRGMA